jgi:hypothetical protein
VEGCRDSTEKTVPAIRRALTRGRKGQPGRVVAVLGKQERRVCAALCDQTLRGEVAGAINGCRDCP